ncbi:hypothetical protein M2475_001531 [Breznakia sp. PF5-3]|uniref:leucine-rich repeat protein n=1 Tax=unclassified Breznakia TaxID=2623764 RepID=UPI002406C8C5|nr:MULTISPECIES: leucine-rich repeat protein [unclassified Breznakia]MDF9825110.1 hypothetical protein [Breznakia sp. PM6-1]MDF9835957.1 hypothetical protein [Breznakia sp. PF5-3]
MRGIKRVFLRETILVFIFLVLIFVSISQITTPTGAISKDHNFKYQQLADEDYQIIGYLSFDSKVDIPKVYKKRTVTSIESEAFLGSKELEEISIPGTINYIGKNAFLDCSNLKKIVVPDGSSEKYANLLSSGVLGNTSTKLIMYEGNALHAVVNDIEVKDEQLQNGVYFHGQNIGDSLFVDLRFMESPTYVYEQDMWSKVQGMESTDVSEHHNVTWYFQSASSGSEKIIDGNVLDIKALNEDNAGLYTAKEDDEIIFRLQLDVNDPINGNTNKINTGDSIKINILILLLGSIVFMILYKRKRSYKNR